MWGVHLPAVCHLHCNPLTLMSDPSFPTCELVTSLLQKHQLVPWGKMTLGRNAMIYLQASCCFSSCNGLNVARNARDGAWWGATCHHSHHMMQKTSLHCTWAKAPGAISGLCSDSQSQSLTRWWQRKSKSTTQMAQDRDQETPNMHVTLFLQHGSCSSFFFFAFFFFF